jgi:hypothetical protein
MRHAACLLRFLGTSVFLRKIVCAWEISFSTE